MSDRQAGKIQIRLRHPGPADADAFIALVKASRDYHSPWVHPPSDRARFLRYASQADMDRNQFFLIRNGEDESIVGVVNLSEIVRGVLKSAFMGFYGFAGTAGRGFMTAGVRAAIRFAFDDLKLHRVEANVQPDNTRSLTLVKRCGFRREGYSPRYLKIGGRWRDHERWAILSDD